MRGFLRFLGLGVALGIVGALALAYIFRMPLGLTEASLDVSGQAPRPSLSFVSRTAWEETRRDLKERFAEVVYGPWPRGLAVELVERREVDAALPGGTVEEITLRLGRGDSARTLHLAVAWPKGAKDAPVPLVIAQTFLPNCYSFEMIELTAPDGEPCPREKIPAPLRIAARGIFGAYIAQAPLEEYLARGVAYASFYAGQVVPDSTSEAEEVLAALRADNGIESTGAVALWSYGFKAAIDHLQTDDRLDSERIVVFGHSRHGKSALLAAAMDRRINGVIAHQSGFGGASLNASPVGETVARMTRVFPHWFDADYHARARADESWPIDQHQLLALIAPRPIFLGNARSDVWSDPTSSFRAARAASQIYDLYGHLGLTASDMRDFDPGAPIAYFLRPGGHGIQRGDIEAIFAFLEAHFVTSPGDTASASEEEQTP